MLSTFALSSSILLWFLKQAGLPGILLWLLEKILGERKRRAAHAVQHVFFHPWICFLAVRSAVRRGR